MDNLKIDYGKYVNNFERHKDIPSLLCLGLKVFNPYISIVIPTYRRVDTLKEALDSTMNQLPVSFEYEILVVDNEPSSEFQSETEKLVNSYKSDKLLYYKNTQNLGMFGNWNRCIELARGKWISFLHDDDLLDPDYLARIDRIIKSKAIKKEEIGYIQTRKRIINENKLVINELTPNLKSKIVTKLLGDKLMRVRLLDAIVQGESPLGAPTCGTLLNRKAIIKVGGYNPEYYPSGDVYPPIKMLKNYRVYKTYAQLGSYRWSNNASLNPDVVLGWIKENHRFREYLYTTSLAGKVFGKIFKNEHYTLFLKKIIKLTEQLKNNNLKLDFDNIYKSEPNKVKIKFLVFLRKIYFRIKIVNTIIFG